MAKYHESCWRSGPPGWVKLHGISQVTWVCGSEFTCFCVERVTWPFFSNVNSQMRKKDYTLSSLTLRKGLDDVLKWGIIIVGISRIETLGNKVPTPGTPSRQWRPHIILPRHSKQWWFSWLLTFTNGRGKNLTQTFQEWACLYPNQFTQFADFFLQL